MYCTIRTEKIKDRAQATEAIEHNLRLRFQSNIDQTRSAWNKCLFDGLKINQKDATSFQKKLSEKYESLKIKEKKGNVFAMEFVLGASPEFFFGHIDGFSIELWDRLSMENPKDRKVIKNFWKQIDRDKLKAWVKTQEEFAKEEWGDSLERIDLHLDEKSPHIHVILNCAHKSVKKYKNQKGEFFKETYSLNADRFNPQYLTSLQDRYALKNAFFGLKRGTKGSARKHKKLKDFYEERAVETLELVEIAEKFQRNKELFPLLKKTILDSFGAIYQLIAILEKKDLSEEEIKYVNDISLSLPNAKKNKIKKDS